MTAPLDDASLVGPSKQLRPCRFAASSSAADNPNGQMNASPAHAVTIPVTCEIVRRISFLPCDDCEVSSALIDRDDFLADRLADILAQRTEETVVFQLLENMRAPPGGAGNRKHRRKEVGRDP